MFELTLPEPAFSLYSRTHDLLDRWLPRVVPGDGVWAIGGGTVLGALWGHRKSTDLDIFLPSDAGLAAISPDWDPEFTERLAARGASGVRVQTQGLKFQFASGRLELTALDPIPPLPPEAVMILDRARHVLPTACILAGKLAGRGLRLPPRDVFDIGVAARHAPDALACAVNHLDPQTRTEVIARVVENEDAYRASAPSAILDPAPRWKRLLEEGPRLVASEVADLVYRDMGIDFHRGRARVSVTNAAQGRISREFNSPDALLAGLTAMGLQPRIIARHGTMAKFVQSIGPKFATPGVSPRRD